MEPVTSVLLERIADPRGLRPMVVCSVVLHLVIVVVVVAAPTGWLGATTSQPKVIMSVSLGGAPGPTVGGLASMASRPVQRAVAEPPARPEPVREPAARTPEMTAPAPSRRKPAPRPEPVPPAEPRRTEVKAAPEDATGRVPTTGAQERFGEGFAETGVSGLGVGLSTGGGGTGAAIDIGSFCCVDFLSVMTRRIKENWDSRQGVGGTSIMRFTVQRDGRITDIVVEQSAGYVLDLTAQRALQRVRQLPPLPAAYAHPSLTVYLKFEYQR